MVSKENLRKVYAGSALALVLLLWVLISHSKRVDPFQGFAPVTGPAPSSRVIAFYYGWYGTPGFDGKWIHWEDPNSAGSAPDDIQSDYFPKLGLYSSADRQAIAQQMVWVRKAGIGVLAYSYWEGETLDDRVKLFMDIANHYGIKVAFHLEPSAKRDAESYASIILKLNDKFGKHPAFFRTNETGKFESSHNAKPLYFIWGTDNSNTQGGKKVLQSYWRAGNDLIHKKTGALLVASPGPGNFASAVNDGHFDGAYNYATLHLAKEGFFSWEKELPAGSLAIPSVIPGFSAKRLNYPSNTYVSRRNGAEYDFQWKAALGEKVKPRFVAITSWNEWHEGTQLEPAEKGSSTVTRKYDDYSSLSEMYYLDATAQWVKKLDSNFAGGSSSQGR